MQYPQKFQNQDKKRERERENSYVWQVSDTRHMRVLPSVTDVKPISWVLKWYRMERRTGTWEKKLKNLAYFHRAYLGDLME